MGPEQGPPRNPANWLVVVGRNAGIDGVRRAARQTSLPDEIAAPDEDTEDTLAQALDDMPYGDDILRLLLHLFPEEPEVLGLTALMLLQNSRAAARFDDAGTIVLLEDQDRRLWDGTAIAEGIALTDRAFRLRQPGPYQLQAAIAALHARATSFEATDWAQIEQLYEVLFRFQPTPVVALNHAVAVSHVRGAQTALALVDTLASYFYYHGVRGYLLERLGRKSDAREAYALGLGLANSAAEAAQIRACLGRLG